MNYELRTMNWSEVRPYVAAEVLALELYQLGVGKALGEGFLLVLAVAADGKDAATGGHNLSVPLGCACMEDDAAPDILDATDRGRPCGRYIR